MASGEFAATAANEYVTQYILAYEPGIRNPKAAARAPQARAHAPFGFGLRLADF